MPTRPDGLYVGAATDPATHERSDRSIGLDPDDLTTHGVIVGMTGSGKTGLGVVLLEEALAAAVPTLIIDPKGDMGNLLLTFPDLAPDDFAPWVPTGEDPAATAATWRDGLADWSIDGTQIGALRAGHRMTVYTPGSSAGVPLNLIGSMAPPAAVGSDDEAVHDEVEALVQGLLGLVGVTSDPLSGREHVLMANIVTAAWAAGETLDLATLLVRIQDPPMRKLGVIDVDAFFPRADRTELMMRLNGLLASPSFAAWATGDAIDIERMLWAPDGSANAAVVYLAHLSDDERQMVVTLLLSKLVAWMRTQQGSTRLRVLVYMDEVYGFVPPSAAPPSKKPILTLFKQARAFGVGVVLATQNPVDLDYKAISNAGTWLIGRLQTERDKARLMEGLTAASGAVDVKSVDATISALAKREFLLHTTKGSPTQTFAVRWAMSYLCGPLARDQLRQLPGMAEQMSRPSEDGATAPALAAEPSPGAGAGGGAGSAGVGADESVVMPEVADGVAVRYLDVAAPWASTVAAAAGGRRLQAALAVRVQLLYDDTPSKLHHTEELEAVFAPLDGPTIDPARAYPVDYDDRDLLTAAPTGAVYVLPAAPIATKKYFTSAESAVKDHLVRNRRTTIFANKGLKLYSRPGESEEEFAARCTAAADAAADAEADKIRARLDKQRDRLQATIEQQRQRAEQLEAEAASSRRNTAVSVGSSVLGMLLGGRKSARSIGAAANRAATGRSRTQRVDHRMDQALARIEEKMGDVEELQEQLTTEIAEIVDRWDDVAAAVETVEVPLERSDVTIEQVALVWIPTA